MQEEAEKVNGTTMQDETKKVDGPTKQDENEVGELANFSDMCNVNELMLDFKNVSDDLYYDSPNLYDLDFVEMSISSHVDLFKKLTKMSVTVLGSYTSMSRPSGPSGPPGLGWSILQPTEAIFRFETRSIPLIQACLGLYPKLTTIHASTLDLEERPLRYSTMGDPDLEGPKITIPRFCLHAFGLRNSDDVINKKGVTWFWMAEKGKTLQVDWEARVKQWEELISSNTFEAVESGVRGSFAIF